jgi:hypothetical protein
LERRAQSLYCAISLAEGRNARGLAKRRNKAIAPYLCGPGHIAALDVDQVPDVATPEGQAALFAACPEPDILINNNAGPPPRDFRELTRRQIG